MVYKYLYQDKANHNLEGEIKAKDRADAYQQLRKQGIRPYRVIGDDPVNWKPWAIAVGYAVLMTAVLVLAILLAGRDNAQTPVRADVKPASTAISDEEFRERAERAVYQAPEAFRYNVWKGVNARLEERGLEPIPRPEGLIEE